MRTRHFVFFIFLTGVLLFPVGYLLGVGSDDGSNVVLEISSREDLEAISVALYEEMLRTGVTLTNKEIDLLVAPDRQADVYRLPPNERYSDWDGDEASVRFSSGYGEGGTWVHYRTTYDNGTRIYEKYSQDGELLKYFLVNDEPEKHITIIIKE